MSLIKWSVGTIAGLILLLLSVFILVLSPWGARLGLSIADSLSEELRIDYKSGGLGSQLVLAELRWQQQDLEFAMQDIRLELGLSCLMSFSVCIEQLSAGKIDVQVSAPTSSAEESPPAAEKIVLPFNLIIKSLTLGSLNLLVEQQVALSWQTLHSRLQFHQSLDIEQLQVSALRVDLLSAQHKQPPEPPLDWTNWQYQAMAPVDINLPIAVNLTQLLVAPLTVASNGEPTLLLESLTMAAAAMPDKITLSQLQLQHALGQLSLSGELWLDGLLSHQFKLNADYHDPQLAPLKAQFSSQGDIKKLSSELHVSGATRADILFTAQLAEANLPVDLLLTWQDLSWPLGKTAKADDSVLVYSPQGKLTIKGDLTALQIVADTEFSGASVPDTVIALDASASSKQLTVKRLQANTLGGQIVTSGTVAFSPSLSAMATMQVQHINPGVLNAAYQADVSGQLETQLSQQNGQWQGAIHNIDLAGVWRDFPLKVTGELTFDHLSNVTVDNISIKNGDNSVLLAGTLQANHDLDLTLNIDAQALEQSIAEMQGQVTAEATVTGTLEQPELKYALAGQQLSFANISIEKIQGQGELIWNEIKPLNLSLDVQQIVGRDNQIDEAKLSLSGNAASHQLVLDTTSNKTNLLAKIEGTLLDNAWQGRWLEGQIESSYGSLSLLEPFDIMANWQEQHYAISAHCWQQEQSDMCIKQASFKNQQAQWDIALRDLNLLPLLHRILPDFPAINSASTLSMSLQGDWITGELPKARLTASLSPAIWRFEQQQNLALELQTFNLQAQLSPQNVSLQSELRGPEIGVLQVNLQGEAGDFTEQLERPVSGEFTLSEFNLAPFRILLPSLDKLQGMIAGQTKISGTLKRPLFNGQLQLSDGAVQGQGIPLVLSGLKQNIELQGDKALLSGSYLLGKGLGTVEGQINWYPELTGNIKVAGEALEFDYQSMLRAQVSPKLDIDFTPQLVKVSGEVAVPYARFKLRELPQGSVSPSKDVVLVEQQAKLNAQEQFIELNIMVSVDPQQRDEVKLDAFGLTTDLRGKLQLENSKRGMVANGEVQLVNGRYRAYGQNLIIREGDIMFNGPLDRPFLNIEAIRDPKLTADDVVAGIRVDGAADNPKVEVFSEPMMEQQQSLSYMLTGMGLGETSGDSQDVVLTNMLLGFGLGQSENMVTSIGQKLGFKDVNLDTSGQGDGTQLNVTGYVAPGVQLRYGVGVFDSVSEVAIRYELLPQLYIEAVSGLSNAIDIYYRFSVEGSEAKASQANKSD